MGLKPDQLNKMRVDGMFTAASRELRIASIYVAPEGKNDSEDGAEAWEKKSVASNWNWRGTKDTMEAFPAIA